MLSLQERALALYQDQPEHDPLLLDAIRVLQNPDDPHYAVAAEMVVLMEEALDW